MGTLQKTKNVVEDEGVLRVGTRNCSSHADGTCNIQARKFVTLVHLAFGYTDIGPLERGICLRLRTCAHESNPGLIEQGITKHVGMSKRENDEIGIAWAVEPTNVTGWIQGAPRESNQLIYPRDEESRRELALLRNNGIEAALIPDLPRSCRVA